MNIVDLLTKEYRKVVKALDPADPKPLEPCSDTRMRQFGLPCSHVIMDCIVTKKPLIKDDIWERWWLRKAPEVSYHDNFIQLANYLSTE